MFKRLNEKLQKYVESNLPEIQKLDVICINRLYDLTAKIYVGKKANTWSIFRDKRENGEYNYYRISPRFDKEKEAIEWYANNLLDQYGEEDLYKALKSGNIKVVNDELKAELGISSFKEAVADLKPFKFTFDFGQDRIVDYIEYGKDEEDAKANLLKNTKYLQGEEENIIKVEPVKEDHEEVTLPFTMIHRSSEGPDASGEVTFFPTPFGYEYECTEKDFNGKGPQWSTIRTIEGIKIWFRNVLFEFGAKTVTIGDETWDIDDFPKEDVNEGRSTQGHRQEILKEINYDELAKKLIAKEGKEKLEKGIKKNNTKEYFYSLVGKDENIDPTALTDAIERQLDSNSIDEDYELTNEDMCNTIDEDRHDLLVAVKHCVNKFNSLSNKWDKEVQKMTFDRICEILETAEENLSNMAFRMGKMK